MGGFLLALGGLCIAGALIRVGLGQYHQRKLAEIETAGLELDGLVKILLSAITFAWQCHECGTPLLTREAVQAHAGSRSACAVIVAELDEAEAAEEAAAEEARWHAEQTAAPVREDAWPALGAEEAPAELGAAQ